MAQETLESYVAQENTTPQNLRLLQKIDKMLTELYTGTGGSAAAVATSGSPEGVITANPRALAWDESAGTLYIKRTGTGNTGWAELLALP